MHEDANFLGMSGLEATKHVALTSVGQTLDRRTVPSMTPKATCVEMSNHLAHQVCTLTLILRAFYNAKWEN